uniref:Toprim domain-containing protein n=1 Tax=Geoglobus ahangari TaxID=113653 RepID=A0A7C3UHZ9_9EURY
MISLEEYRILLKAIEDLRIKCEEGSVIIVEGREDKIALENLGVKGEIIEISKIPNSVLVDRLGCREAVILTDWDYRGERISEQLERIIEFKDVSIRMRIRSVVRKYIRSVEELPRFIEKIENVYGHRLL